MMDHKTNLSRTAKAAMMLKIADIGEDRKQELIRQYSNTGKHIESSNAQKILIGNWLNNGAKMLQKGATEEELTRVAEHIVVLLGAIKYKLDVQQSYKDHRLLDLTRKYFAVYKKVKTKEGEIMYEKESVLKKRKRMHEKFEKHREELKEQILNMKDSGMTNSQIANELVLPESTIRNLLKESE